eukprot:m.157317 g.157317  ORF g.157317 m.157317 type:complete len:372 (+) comp17966_c0_seq1:146-1261(+)
MGKFQKLRRGAGGTITDSVRANPLSSDLPSSVSGKVKGSRIAKSSKHDSGNLEDVWAPSAVEETPSPFSFTSAFALDTAAAKANLTSLRLSMLQVGTGAARAAGQNVASVHIDTSLMEDVGDEQVSATPTAEVKQPEHRAEDRAMTKVARRKQRREKFLQKLSALEKSKKKHADIAHKRAHPHAVVGDLTRLQEAISKVEKSSVKKSSVPVSAPKPSSKAPKVALPKKIAAVMRAQISKSTRKTTSKRGRLQALALETSNFKDVLAHAHFKINPVATIKEHVKNSMAADRSAMDTLYPGQEEARLNAIRLALKSSKTVQTGNKRLRRPGAKVATTGKSGLVAKGQQRFTVGKVTAHGSKRKSARSKAAKRK